MTEDFFRKCTLKLDDALTFINENKKYNVTNIPEKSKKIYTEKLTQLMLSLDDIDNSTLDIRTKSEKRTMIIAIQNVLSQLDNLFTGNKMVIPISYKPNKRISYIPENRESHYSITNIYDQGPQNNLY